ncbi:MAG: DUF6122 family protein [Gammaproteobacteria bacterium]
MHIALHLFIPLLVAIWFFPARRWTVLLVLLLTMLVDLDHLLATPVYDPTRCSIGFHPLHGFIPIGCYGLMLLHKKTMLIGLGLTIHMLLDLFDCVAMGNLPWTLIS